MLQLKRCKLGFHCTHIAPSRCLKPSHTHIHTNVWRLPCMHCTEPQFPAIVLNTVSQLLVYLCLVSRAAAVFTNYGALRAFALRKMLFACQKKVPTKTSFSAPVCNSRCRRIIVMLAVHILFALCIRPCNVHPLLFG